MGENLEIWELEVMEIFYVNGSAENDVDFYTNVDMSIYMVFRIYIYMGGATI